MQCNHPLLCLHNTRLPDLYNLQCQCLIWCGPPTPGIPMQSSVRWSSHKSNPITSIHIDIKTDFTPDIKTDIKRDIIQTSQRHRKDTKKTQRRVSKSSICRRWPEIPQIWLILHGIAWNCVMMHDVVCPELNWYYTSDPTGAVITENLHILFPNSVAYHQSAIFCPETMYKSLLRIICTTLLNPMCFIIRTTMCTTTSAIRCSAIWTSIYAPASVTPCRPPQRRVTTRRHEVHAGGR